MKKHITILAAFIFSIKMSHGQISTLPYSEGFENPFTQGFDIDFVPNISGNEVASTNRIFQDATSHQSGAASCAIVPTSGFEGSVLIKTNLSAYANVFVGFWASSGLNGTGTRPAIVEMSASIDNGASFSPPVLIGDSSVFANANTSWNHYQYALPYYTNNNSNVIVKIKVSRGDGTGTTARLLIDDLTVDFTANDVTPPYVLDAYATSLSQVKIAYSEGVNASGSNTANYSGLSNLGAFTNTTLNDTITIDLTSALTEGHWYFLDIANIQDAAGNTMLASQQFVITYNDNTGNLKITEINYDNPGADSLSFIELKNMDSQPITIGGWVFTKGLSGYLPSDLIIQPGQYIVFAQYSPTVNSFFNISSYQVDGSLDNSGENVVVMNSAGVLIDSVHYSPLLPWDTMANGYGPSLVLCNESADNDLFTSWTSATNFVGLLQGVDSIFANPMDNCALTATIEENGINISETKISPNPFSNEFKFDFYSTKNQMMKIEIYDLQGKRVKAIDHNSSVGKNSVSILTDELNTGLYILRVNDQAYKINKIQ